jgi:inhibitor of cysteine peptidase
MKRQSGVFFLAVLLAACSQTASVTEADDGGSVSIGVGDELVISLPANPSTGYSWVFGPFYATVLEQVGEAEFEAESDALGAAGNYTVRFEGRVAGTVELILDYERPFEDAEPEDTFVITITVS